MKNTITQKELKSRITYYEETGLFVWKNPQRIAGSFDGHGYIQINFDGRVLKAHRLAWLYIHGTFPSDQLDHINHNPIDNRLINLRECNNSENSKNRPMQANNKSGCIGVKQSKNGNYRAYIMLKQKQISLGTYKHYDEAVEARKDAELKYGFHKNYGNVRI